MRYSQSGVEYGALDAFKRACQQAAATTAGMLAQHGLNEPQNVRGESAYLLETSDAFWAHVEEGLGTKNLVADAMGKLTGQRYYKNIGIDTVATIVNDMITCGALPISVAMHAAVGESNWFDDLQRSSDLAAGFAEGCRRAGAVWGGGETPALAGIVEPNGMVLAGSAMGRVMPKSNHIVGQVRDGDAIVLLASSGVHTNGLSLCRAIAEKLPQGYLTELPSGRAYGQALLDESIIYVDFLRACQRNQLQPHYAAHITGHGWRKLMRLSEPWVYWMTNPIPPDGIPEIFQFICASGPVDQVEAWGTFNMGAGFAAYVDATDAERCIQIAKAAGYSAWVGGRVRKEGTRKAVVIEPLHIEFEGESLRVR